jgi:hypothetical protein
MIIYGTRNKQVLKEDIMDSCEHCGNTNSMELHIFRRYFHVFWIPFFPVKKFGISQCNHCKQVLQDKEMPQKLKDTYNGYKANAKTPWWMYIGLVVILLLAFSIQQSIQRDNKRTKAFFAKPLVGDIYHIKTPSNNHTLYKIATISVDSIFFELNNYEANMESGLDKLEDKMNYGFNGIVDGYSREEVKNMMDKGRIEKIKRKE